MVLLRSLKIVVVTGVLASVLALLSNALHVHDHDDHAYVAPGPDDSRSPCPALNVLANHGYLPHDGEDISPFDLIRALQDAYQLDVVIAHVLALGGFFLVNHPAMTDLPSAPDFKHPLAAISSSLHSLDAFLEPASLLHTLATLHEFAADSAKYPRMSLARLGLHNHIEHDASITHDDAPSASPHLPAPPASNSSLFAAFLGDSRTRTHIELVDLGTARVRRERETLAWTGRGIDPLHAEIAKGEAALVIGIFGEPLPGSDPALVHTGRTWTWDGLGVPFDTMRSWWLEERMPAGWKPVRTTSLASTKAGNAIVGARMDALRKQEQDALAATAPALQTPAPAAENVTDTDAVPGWAPAGAQQVLPIPVPAPAPEIKA